MMAAGTSLTVRVARKAAEAQDICSLELVAADGGALPAFSAGSHIDVHLPGGLVRQYSLCNDPAESHRYLVAVLREPTSRGGSVAVHDAVREGDTLAISAPRNAFALAGHAQRHLLLAGGIGITPILCMAERLAVLQADFDMHYAARSGADAAPRSGDAAFEVRLASSGRVIPVPRDRTVTQALADAGVDIMVSCEQGVCGTCLTRVLQGEPEHRDSYLTPEEQAANDQFTPCCSRSKSACLVLDL